MEPTKPLDLLSMLEEDISWLEKPQLNAAYLTELYYKIAEEIDAFRVNIMDFNTMLNTMNDLLGQLQRVERQFNHETVKCIQQEIRQAVITMSEGIYQKIADKSTSELTNTLSKLHDAVNRIILQVARHDKEKSSRWIITSITSFLAAASGTIAGYYLIITKLVMP